ncbi:MAG: hypothetical protein WBP45_02980, partial [Daejeonella sp.]
MRLSIVAGYKNLFPNGRKAYESFVEGIPSDVVISFFIALNNELNSNEQNIDLQKRIYLTLTKRFSNKQKQELSNAFKRFRIKTEGRYEGPIFARRYLIEVVIKELNNYRNCPHYIYDPIDEYNLFKAYLLAVDEVNARDHNPINLKKEDSLSPYPLLWLSILNQWEWNEKTNIIFETFKLLCFLQYVKFQYNGYLKEYINSLGFKSISQLLESFNQINNSTYIDNKGSILRKLVYINPLE